MRAAAPPLAVPAATVRDFVELTKPRIAVASALAALAGFLCGATEVDGVKLLVTVAGVGAMACAAGVLNQVIERDVDAQMPRTASRPLPAGRLRPATASAFGVLLALASVVVLVAFTNALTVILALFALASYLLVYTPLKRVTSFNTFVGAVPGALPPVLGYAAAANDLGPRAYALFAILFLWQLPHFLAIAWLYRRDYAAGGLVMLPAHDPDGSLTARQACVHAVALGLATLLPFVLGMGGPIYLVGVVLLGAWFLAAAFRFLRAPSEPAARRLLAASLVHLPGVLCLLAIGR